jgi:hypothetical protein
MALAKEGKASYSDVYSRWWVSLIHHLVLKIRRYAMTIC